MNDNYRQGFGTRRRIAAAAVPLMAGLMASAAWADSAPAQPAGPALADILHNSGLSASGYVDATYSYFTYHGSTSGGASPAPGDYSGFVFQQAGLTLAYQPAAGFGALVDVVATPYSSIYVDNYAPDAHYYLSSGAGPGAPRLQLFQGYAQYASGSWTLIAGKFSTLAGAEVYAPTGNTNVTRSILFTEEPLTHTGVRATYAVNGSFSLIAGINNGWINSGDEASIGAQQTIEAGISVTAGKSISWTLQNYYGRDALAAGWGPAGLHGDIEFLDSVLTWNATPALSVIGTVDYGNIGATASTPSATWWGVAGYVNYALDSRWRISLRGEYFDDQDGYLTGAYIATAFPAPGPILTAAQRLKEGTLTLGYDPAKNVELRMEGRYDAPDSVNGVRRFPDTTQAWVEALLHF